MISKLINWLEYKRGLAITISNLYYRMFLEEECVSPEEIIPKGNIEEFRIDKSLIENSMKKVSEKWENYYAEAVYYAMLSKSKVRLIFTSKSRLEKILENLHRR